MSKVDRPSIRIPLVSDGILKPNANIYKDDDGDLYFNAEDLAFEPSLIYGIEGADSSFCSLIIYVPQSYIDKEQL
jgi:hypothetical protein